MKKKVQSGASILRTYSALEKIRQSFFDLERKFGMKLPLSDVEDRWGEYYIANKLVREGIEVIKMQKRGIDILTKYGGVEVKTSRSTLRFKPDGKVGYDWDVKKKQWQDKQFQYLVCVLADENPPRTLAFTRGEVLRKFTVASLRRTDTREPEEDSRLLDFMKDGGLEAFEKNRNASRKKSTLSFKGDTSPLEHTLNASPTPVFKEYTLDRILRMMKRTKV